MKKKVSIIEPVGIDVQKFKEKLYDCEVNYLDSRKMSDLELINEFKSSHIIVLTNKPLSYEVISNLPDLEMVSVAFAGFDHVDSTAIQEKNITLTNAVGYANVAVAELVIGQMISLARKIPQNYVDVFKGATTNTGTQLKDKKLGIIGGGNIGKYLQKIAQAMGLECLMFGRSNSQSDLEKIFQSCDYISLHVPLNQTTKGMINYDLLKLMKPTSFIINCARGPIINENDLLIALDEGLLSGAALDVFETEPPLISNHPLSQSTKVICTPHIGFNTQEALKAKGEMALNNICQYLNI
jgi:phosphoglycerate dehydrogenase-like enzyme